MPVIGSATPAYCIWVNALRNGQVNLLDRMHHDDPEMVVEYRSRRTQGLGLPEEGMNSAHVAAFYCQGKALEWVLLHAPCLVQEHTDEGFTVADLGERGLEAALSSLSTQHRAGEYLELLLSLPVEQVEPRLMRLLPYLRTLDQEPTMELTAKLSELCNEYPHLSIPVDLASLALRYGSVGLLKHVFEQDPSSADRVETARHQIEHLFHAAAAGHLNLFRWWNRQEKRPDWTVRNSSGENLLRTAAHCGQAELAAFLQQETPLGRDPEIIRGALQAASAKGHLQVVTRLLHLPSITSTNAGHFPTRYQLWNLALARYIERDAEEAALARGIQPLEKGTSVTRESFYRLPYTTSQLWEASQDFFPSVGEEQVEDDLVQSVREAYRAGAVKIFTGHIGPYPLCVGFLVASIIAASRMERDDEVDANAGNYYGRLGEVLGYGFREPDGLDRHAFRNLWEEVRNWLKPLVLPDGSSIVDRPISQALLRAADLKQLPNYFDGRYAPYGRVNSAEVERSFSAWAAGHLTPRGKQAVADPARRPAILEQVSGELARWDGTVLETGTSRRHEPGINMPRGGNGAAARSAQISVGLYLNRRRGEWQFRISAPRGRAYPPSFPTELPGQPVLEGGDAGRYLAIPVTESGALQYLADGLRHGLTWETQHGDRTLRLWWPGLLAVPFSPADGDVTWWNSRSLLLNAPCQLLCHSTQVSHVREYLTAACGPGGFSESRARLLDGWVLFENVLVQNPDVPIISGLEYLRPRTQISLVYRGGLRLGHTLSWLEGSLPEAQLSGNYLGLPARVAGEPAEVDANGVLQLDRYVRRAGRASIEIGTYTETIRVEAPRRHPATRKPFRLNEMGYAAGFNHTGFFRNALGDPPGELPPAPAALQQNSEQIPQARLGKLADQMLLYASHVAEGSWNSFESHLEALLASGPDVDGAERIRYELEEMGYLDSCTSALSKDDCNSPDRWRAAASQLLLIGDGTRAVLSGARDAELLDQVHRAAKAEGALIRVSNAGPTAGSTYLLEADLDCFEQIARRIEVPLVRHASEYFLRAYTPVRSQLRENLNRRRVETELQNWNVRRYDFDQLRWEECAWAAVPTTEGSVVEQRVWGQVRRAVWHQGQFIRMPHREAVHIGARLQHRRLLYYNIQTRHLWVPAMAPLPVACARAARVCSGWQLHFRFPWTVYEDVDPRVAAVISVQMGGAHGQP